MKRNKGAFLLALSLASAMLLSACGGGGSSSQASGQTSAPSTGGSSSVASTDTMTMAVTGAELPAIEGVTDVNFIAVRGSNNEIYAEYLDKLNGMDQYSTSTKWFQADELDTQMNMAVTSGSNSPYQVFQVSKRIYSEYTGNEWLLPLDDYIEKYNDVYNFDDIPEAAWDSLRGADGHIYGIPTGNNNQHLFYRTDLFEQYGVEVPATIDALLDACEKLKSASEIEYPLALVYGSGNGAGTEFTNMMAAVGGVFFDAENNPTFNDEKGVEAVEIMQKLYSYMPPAATTYTNDDVMVLLQTGKVAIANIWTTRAPYMDDEEVSSVVGLIGYAAAPVVTSGMPPMSYQSPEVFVIPANVGGNPEAVFLALAEVTSYEAQLAALQAAPVPRQQCFADSPDIMVERPNYVASNETTVLGAKTPPDYPYFGSVMNLIGTYVAQAVDGSMGIQDALDAAAAECVVVLQDQGYLE